jgi:DNA (cytosine-5)-methyltransferase 1
MKQLRERLKKNMPSPMFIDLFCGCGGMSWGLKQAGFQALAGVDLDLPSIETYRRNFGVDAGCVADLSACAPQEFAEQIDLRPEELDVLVGGPPCQGFSKNVPRKYRYLEDPKNRLVRYFLEYAEYLRPKFIVMENVAEMKNGFDGAYTDEITDRLEAIDYRVAGKVLYAPDYGVPQRRRRAFFFANRLGFPVEFPEPTHFLRDDIPALFSLGAHYITVREAIGDLPSLEHGAGANPMEYDQGAQTAYQILMRQKSEVLYDHVARKLAATQYKRLSSIVAGQGARDLPAALQPKSHFSGAYGRLEWNALAPTITRWVFHPGSGRFGHPSDVRVITIREAARLQSFSDDFIFTGTYIQKSHQVGNAVPPLMMRAFGEKIKALLGQTGNHLDERARVETR